MTEALTTIEQQAEAAWVEYRARRQAADRIAPRRLARQMRKRDFIAGYYAASDYTPNRHHAEQEQNR